MIVADSTLPSPYRSAIRGRVRLCYCDPPSGRGYNDNSDRLSYLEYQAFSLAWLGETVDLLDYIDGSRLVLCLHHKIRRLFEHLIHHNFHQLTLEQEIIWHYDFGLYTRKKFVPSHDNILVYRTTNSIPPFNWQDVAIQSQRLTSGDSRADYRGRTPGTVWSIPRVPGNSLTRFFQRKLNRVSQQPEELAKRIILAYTNPNDIVFDPFLGSGTTAVICRTYNRRFYGQDNHEEYVKQAKQRVEKQGWMTLIRGKL